VTLLSGNGMAGTTVNGNFTMYMNFTSGLQFYMNEVTGICEPYGLDFWNEWCYGLKGQNQEFQGVGNCTSPSSSSTNGNVNSNTQCSIWRNGDFVFAGTYDNTCAPLF
jgi:hypothetical protein